MSAGPGSALARGGALLMAGLLLVVGLLVVVGDRARPLVDGDRPGPAPALTPDTTSLSCRVEAAGLALPDRIRESSGLARSARDPAVFWTHNDSGDEPVLYAIGADGAIAAAVRVAGARAVDWEDLEAAPCPTGEGSCLYIADTGDNEGGRDHVVVYVVPEPGPGEATVAARALPARYPDGPRDAEGLFVAQGRIYIVTKGREGPIRLYRYPDDAATDADRGASVAGAGAIATLEAVTVLAPRPRVTDDYVTAATLSADGRWVALRTYRSLLVYDVESVLAGEPGSPRAFDLAPLREEQGESLVVADSTVWLTSEGPTWSRLVCGL